MGQHAKKVFAYSLVVDVVHVVVINFHLVGPCVRCIAGSAAHCDKYCKAHFGAQKVLNNVYCEAQHMDFIKLTNIC